MNYNFVHFIGIGGISMSGLAKFLKSKNIKVSGSDLQKSSITQMLEDCGINVYIGCNKKNITTQDLVVYTDAVKENNKELKKARKMQIRTISRADFLAEISSSFKKVVAVSGCHGKTTTTGMLNFAVSEFKPTSHIGGMVGGENFFIGKNKLFITEACEYKKNLLKLRPDVGVILNIDLDHLDCYKNLKEVKQTFNEFAQKIKKNGFLVINGDDRNCKEIKFENKITFGLKPTNDFYAKNIKETSDAIYYDLFAYGRYYERIKINCTIKHNVLNSLATIAVCFALGAKDFAQNIQKFRGIERRNQFIKEINGAKIYHDYAHHPKEILKITSSYKKHCKGKLFVVFESHTYSRTKKLLNEFKTCFKNANELYILPIYPAREKKIKGISGKSLAKHVCGKYVRNYSFCKKKLLSSISKDDIALILGAGSVYKLADML